MKNIFSKETSLALTFFSVAFLLMTTASFSAAQADENTLEASWGGQSCLGDHDPWDYGSEQECIDDHQYCEYHDCDGGYGGGGGGGGGQCTKPVLTNITPLPNSVLSSMKKVTFVVDEEPKKTTVKIDGNKVTDITVTQKPNGKWKVVAKFDNIIDGGSTKIFIQVRVAGGCKKTMTYYVRIGDDTGDDDDDDDDDDVDAPTCRISANPNPIYRGDATKLRWHTEDATKAMINGRKAKVPNGKRWIAPKRTKTYTMTLWGPGGRGECEVTVEVKRKNKKPSCEIWANPDTINRGGSSTLEWETRNTLGAWLDEYGYVDVPNGDQTVSPRRTTTYNLVVWNSDGQVAECQTKVKVKRISWRNARDWRNWWRDNGRQISWNR